MVNLRSTYTQQMPMQRTDWSGEITPMAGMQTSAQTGMQPSAQTNTQMNNGMNLSAYAASSGSQMRGQPNMNHNLPVEVIEAPTTVNEAFLGSLKALLSRNVGNYIVATFLIGTQNTVSWEGFLYEVGNDFVTIYQEDRDRYIVCDMYSLKYMEFYDTRRREMCDQVLGNRNWQMQR